MIQIIVCIMVESLSQVVYPNLWEVWDAVGSWDSDDPNFWGGNRGSISGLIVWGPLPFREILLQFHIDPYARGKLGTVDLRYKL